MLKLVGILCLIGGILLIVSGYNYAHEMGSVVHHFIFRDIPERSKHFMIAGLVLGLLGIFQILTAKK